MTDEIKAARPEGEPVATVEIGPKTWRAALPLLVEIIRHGETVESQRFAEDELRRMADAADERHRLVRDATHPSRRKARGGQSIGPDQSGWAEGGRVPADAGR